MEKRGNPTGTVQATQEQREMSLDIVTSPIPLLICPLADWQEVLRCEPAFHLPFVVEWGPFPRSQVPAIALQGHEYRQPVMPPIFPTTKRACRLMHVRNLLRPRILYPSQKMFQIHQQESEHTQNNR